MSDRARRWVEDNKGAIVLLSAVAIAVVLALSGGHMDSDPVFTCSSGKHFEFRNVDKVSTLGCFE